MPGKFKQALQKAHDKATGTKRSTVSADYTVDGKDKTFSGTLAENKRKAVMNVSNPEIGSIKSVERFKKGEIRSQKLVDKDTSGKVVQVTKRKADKNGLFIYPKLTSRKIYGPKQKYK